MLFEALVNRGGSGRGGSGGLPTSVGGYGNIVNNIGGIMLLSGDRGSSRGAIGGAVLVASKVLRALALLAAYRVLAAGLSSVVFAAATLAITSVVLLILQRPWTGMKLGVRQVVKVVMQSLLLGSSFVLWAGGLLLCGPATTVILEYTEVMLLQLGRSILSRRLATHRLVSMGKSLGLLATVCILLAWEGLGRDVSNQMPRSARLPNSSLPSMAMPVGFQGRAHVVRQPWREGRGQGDEGGTEGAGEGIEIAKKEANAIPQRVPRMEGLRDAKIPVAMAHGLAMSGLDAIGNDYAGEHEWEDSIEDLRREQALFQAEEAAAKLAKGEGDKAASNTQKRTNTKLDSERDQNAAIPFEFAARTPLEFVTGIGMHMLASTLSAWRKVQAHTASRQVGGPKRLFALACPIAALWLYLFIFYTWLSQRGSVSGADRGGGVGAASPDPLTAVLATWRQLLQFAGMGLLVPFYAGNFADKNLPASDSARIGLVSSVASFVFTWSVRMSPIELSSGVVAMTVLFLMLSLGEEVGDDSVPLGVYSVPGLAGHWGWPWLNQALRTLLVHITEGSRSDARSIALVLLVNLVASVLLVAAGVYHWNNRLLQLALRQICTCAVLSIGLVGTMNKYSRASADFSYGYGRFETVCGFTNALLLVFTFVCTVVDDAAALLQAREREGGEEPVAAAAAAAAAAATSVPLIISILVMQGVCAGVVSKLHHSDAAVTSVRVRARTSKSMGIDDSRSERARRLVRASGVPYGVPISVSLSSKMLHVLQSPAKLLRIPDAARNHNLQVVYVHLIGETLGSALLLLSYLADRGEGGAVAAVLKLMSFLSAGIVMTCLVPIGWDASLILLQSTPVEVVGTLGHLQTRIEGMECVSSCSALHIWRLSSQCLVASIKLTAAPEMPGSNLVADVSSLLRQYGVIHSCVEIERETAASRGLEIQGQGFGIVHVDGGSHTTSEGERAKALQISDAAVGTVGGATRLNTAYSGTQLAEARQGRERGCEGEEGFVVQGRADRVIQRIRHEESRGLLGLGLGVVGVEVNGDRGDGGPVASLQHFADSQYLGGGVGPGCHTLGDLGNSGHVRLPPQDLREGGRMMSQGSDPEPSYLEQPPTSDPFFTYRSAGSGEGSWEGSRRKKLNFDSNIADDLTSLNVGFRDPSLMGDEAER